MTTTLPPLPVVVLDMSLTTFLKLKEGHVESVGTGET